MSEHTSLTDAAARSLHDLLETAVDSGYNTIGQVTFLHLEDQIVLHHVDDAGRDDLEVFTDPHDAATIALNDDTQAYRPLKTAPNLRHGWKLVLSGIQDLHLALDFLYPAALGNWRALLLGKNIATPLRDTVNRQTGMYRVTGLITDIEAQGIVDSLCTPGCMRQIQWPIPSDAAHIPPQQRPGEIPLLCTDACSLLIAEARKVVKARMAASPPPQT